MFAKNYAQSLMGNEIFEDIWYQNYQNWCRSPQISVYRGFFEN